MESDPAQAWIRGISTPGPAQRPSSSLSPPQVYLSATEKSPFQACDAILSDVVEGTGSRGPQLVDFNCTKMKI